MRPPYVRRVSISKLRAVFSIQRKTDRGQIMQVQPYLFFDGRCDEALEFYKKSIGAEVKMLMRWKDSPDKSMCVPENAEKVMHAQFQVGDTTIMSSDGRNTGNRSSKALRYRSSPKMRRTPIRSSRRWRKAAKSRCRSPRHSSRRASACLPTSSACIG